MRRVYATSRTELSQFEAFWIVFLVLGGRIVALLAHSTSKDRNYAILFPFTGHLFLLIT